MKMNMMRIFNLILILSLIGCQIEFDQKDINNINNACKDHQGIYSIIDAPYIKYATVNCKDGEVEFLNSFRDYVEDQ